ncbi:MAG TPA: DUF4138 domain-containing protein [Puia sp.]|jgi:hypothetical protein|nr:DUF4138 domain-containing protein [Puia sp.]
MKLLLALLTGYALFSQPGHTAAQAGVAVARDQPAISPGQSAAGREQAAANQVQPAANQLQLKACCQKITRDVQRIYYLNNRNGKVRLVVRGIYTRGKSLFFSLKLINRSPLDYDVDSIRFFVAEKQKGIRSPQRLKELAPIYVYDSATQVKGYSRVASVIVLQRLTLARHRRLRIEVLEKNGGRHLQVQASNFTLETAKLI